MGIELEGVKMTTPTDIAIDEGAYAQPVPIVSSESPGVDKFDTGKAVNYSVANLGASVFYGLFNFGMPLYLSTYHLPALLIGLLANERSFVGAFIQPWIGRISDRTRSSLGRRRPFFLIGVPLVCVGLLLLAIHPPLWVMIGVMAVLAFFLAVAWDPYMAMMADIFPPLHRGRVGGLLGLGAAFGNIAFAVLALTLWSQHEFLIFALVVVVLLVTWAYTFFTVKEPPFEGHAEAAPKAVKFNLVQYVKSLRQYPEAAKYVLAVNFFWLGTGGVVPFITLFGVKALHASENEAFILPIAATVANALFAVPAGYLADRTSKKAVMIAGMTLFGLVALIGSQSQSLLQGSIALGIAGAANAAMAQINPMLSDLVPRKRMAEFIGLGSAVFSFAQPLGSVLAGGVQFIAARFVGDNDAYRWTFITAGLLVLLAGVLLRNVHPERAITEE
jgi:maltose/moltooligosaccharide transporter